MRSKQEGRRAFRRHLVHCFITTLTYSYGLERWPWLWHRRIRCLLMPRTSPYNIRLSSTELKQLERCAGKYTLPYFQVQRAKMILLAAEGLTNHQIAARLDTRREVVCFWRKRFFAERLAGLEERSRPGRPRTSPPRSRRSG
jgi:hypothetical protein